MKTKAKFVFVGGLLVLIVACFHVRTKSTTPPAAKQVPATPSAVAPSEPIPARTPTMAAPLARPQNAPASEALVPVPGGSPHFSIPEANLSIPDELKPCAAKLEKIYAALMKYKKDKGGLPDWLTNLVPDYLPADALFCPNDPPQRAPYYADPNGRCSYTYEFNPNKDANGRSNAQWKTGQVRTFGGVVPVVRCHCHSGATKKVLSLSISGQIYWSELLWETLFPEGSRPAAATTAVAARPKTASAATVRPTTATIRRLTLVPTTAAAAPIVGRRAPAFDAMDLDGKPVKLTDYGGKVLLLDFWSASSDLCREEMPGVKNIYEKYHGDGLEILGVSVDSDRGAQTAAVKKDQIPWRQVFDGKAFETPIARLYRVDGIPHRVLIDRQGVIRDIGGRGVVLELRIVAALGVEKKP